MFTITFINQGQYTVVLLSHQVKCPVDTEVTAVMQASNNALSPASSSIISLGSLLSSGVREDLW